MNIWFDAFSLAAGVPSASDHRPVHPAPAKTRRPGPLRRFGQAIAADIRGTVPLHAFEGLRRWRRRGKAIAALRALNDHTLRDIGVSRGSIRGVVVGAELQAETEARTSRPI